MRENKRNHEPFERRVDFSRSPESYESRVGRFIGDPRYVVKEVKEGEHVKVGLSLEEFAHEKFGKAVDQLEHFGLPIPQTQVVVAGKNSKEASIYIIQKKVEGKTLARVLDSLGPKLQVVASRIVRQIELAYEKGSDEEIEWDNKALLFKIDALIARAFDMFINSYQASNEEKQELPLAYDRYLNLGHADEEEGLLPEILNPANIIVSPGKGLDGELILVDVGLIRLTPGELLHNSFEIGQLEKLTSHDTFWDLAVSLLEKHEHDSRLKELIEKTIPIKLETYKDIIGSMLDKDGGIED